MPQLQPSAARRTTAQIAGVMRGLRLRLLEQAMGVGGATAAAGDWGR